MLKPPYVTWGLWFVGLAGLQRDWRKDVAEPSDEMARLAAAKGAEINHISTRLRRERIQANAEIAALTEQRDEAREAEAHLTRGFEAAERECREWHRQCNVLTEQRDRLVEAATALGEAMNNCQPCDKEFAALWAALDAEAAAKTETVPRCGGCGQPLSKSGFCSSCA